MLRKFLLSLMALVLFSRFSLAQEKQDPYQIALQLIQEAEASRELFLNLSDLELTELPREIGNLSNLQGLLLFNNQLSSLPPEIGNLSNLQSLNLSNNQLNSLPPEIGNLSNLQSLNLFNNQLNSLPTEIGNLSNLQSLDLVNNQLTYLPPEIGNWASLQYLDLSNSQLTSLPPEIGNLKNLQVLHLFGNQLISLPVEITNLSNLCYLDLRRNLFQSIPLELYPIKRLGRTWEECPWYITGLSLDDHLLDTLPEDIVNKGTSVILAYLENQAWWHLQQLIGSIASGIGLLAAFVLVWRWNKRRYKSKRKNEEKR